MTMPCSRQLATAVVLLSGLFSSLPSHSGGFGDALLGGFSEALEEFSRQKEEEIRMEKQLEREKKLIEYRYELEQKRMAEERRARLAAEEKQKRDEEEERKREMNTGTGFFVSLKGYLITNHHVIEEKTHYAIRDLNGNFYRAEVVAQDVNRDLALLKVNGTFPSLRIKRQNLVSKGQRVMALGYPQIAIQGNESKITDGVISSFSGVNNDPNWFQISVPIQGGNSGGPLVTEDGQVVGVVVATANAMRYFKSTGNIPQNVNYAIKSSVLLGFLTENGIDNIPTFKGKTTIDAVDRATVLVIAKGGPIEVGYAEPSDRLSKKHHEKAAIEVSTSRKLGDIFVADGSYALRQAPSTNSDVAFVPQKGIQLKIVEFNESWMKVKNRKFGEGWMQISWSNNNNN